jgi:hypothetical protein
MYIVNTDIGEIKYEIFNSHNANSHASLALAQLITFCMRMQETKQGGQVFFACPPVHVFTHCPREQTIKPPAHPTHLISISHRDHREKHPEKIRTSLEAEHGRLACIIARPDACVMFLYLSDFHGNLLGEKAET